MKRSDEGANVAFRVSLDLCNTPERLLWWMVQYVEFNRVFAGGVAALAGEIARQDDLFRGTETEIAAHVFYAAIDEFRGPNGNVATHRTLAMRCLRSMADELELDLNNFPISECTKRAIQQVRAGYYVRGEDVLEAMGFHIGSESLADGEFNILDTFLREHFPELVETMEAAKTYTWIKIHGTVEAEHYAAASRAVEIASDAVGSLRTSLAVGRGCQYFSEVQNIFMSELCTELQFVFVQ